MPALKLKEGLYSVGVMNPNLRVFDIVMNADYGTTYNSFIIKDEKTALIETCHKTFWEEYLENIRAVTPLDKIDIIVLNHTEPDHSGVLRMLSELCPNAEIYCTKAASVYLKAITNRGDLKVNVVPPSGMTISLGKTSLEFISAPFLHWPDSMFAYAKELKTVFTCDFLGAHYCEPRMLDTKIIYPDCYKKEFRSYYEGIFAPFKPYVLAGLEKLKNLDYDMACVSHGPVLTEEGLLPYTKEKYLEWSTPEVGPAVIPVFYCSAYGCTRALAEEAVKTIKAAYPEAVSEAYDIIKHPMGELCEILNKSAGFMIGSPTLNKDAVAPAWNLLAALDVINMQKKPIGVFGSYGWSGEGVPSMVGRLKGLRLNVIGEGYKANLVPSEDELQGMTAYTEEFIKALKI